jgi:hypothetical protein
MCNCWSPLIFDRDPKVPAATLGIFRLSSAAEPSTATNLDNYIPMCQGQILERWYLYSSAMQILLVHHIMLKMTSLLAIKFGRRYLNVTWMK